MREIMYMKKICQLRNEFLELDSEAASLCGLPVTHAALPGGKLGAISSYHACHNGSFSTISLTKFLYLESRVCSSSRSFQLASESQETVFLVFMGSRLVLPLNTKLNSPMSIFFWLIKMRVARWNDYISLCFSYNPKQP